MSSLQNADELRLDQIRSIACSEPFWSPLYFAHVGLLLFCSFVGAIVFDILWIAEIAVVYVLIFSLEKLFAERAMKRADPKLYWGVLALIFMRAVAYNALVIMVWSLDGDIYKMGAMALLVAATINIMVFHTGYVPIIACVVLPIWLGFVAIASLFFLEFGVTPSSVSAAMIVLCITPYFYLALNSARDQQKAFQSAQQALSQSQRQELLGRLVAGVAHDFNNILSVTLGNAELLKECQNESDRDHYSEEIVKAAVRGASLAGQLLAFARKAKLNPARHRVAPVMRDARNMISRVLPETITVTSSLGSATPPVFVDRNQLDIALLNLAINARDAMPEGGKLALKADCVELTLRDTARIGDHLKPGEYVRFRMIDTGSGMSREVQQKIFDPFFTTKAVGDGSGLGLSMVLGFAKQSGGTVTVESKEGQGTTFTMLLPAAHGQADMVATPGAQLSSRAAASILLVEDEAAVRQVLENQLAAHGHRVSVAANGQEAAAILRSGLRPDVLVTDNVMPGTVQGVDLVCIAHELSPNIASIIISGYPDDARERLKDTDYAPRVMSKPVRQVDLLDAIEDAAHSQAHAHA